MLDPLCKGRVWGMVVMVLGLSAPLPAATLRDVLDHAWSNQPESARLAQYDAQLAASRAWLPEPATLSLSGRSDRIDANNGAREWEAEIGLPLWLPGQRDRAQALAQSEQDAGKQRFVFERWQLAGELREAWWEVRFAEAELNEAERKLKQARQLEADVLRRVNAGDLAPLDLNQARANLATAKIETLRTQTSVARSRQQFNAVSKGAPLPEQPETRVADEANRLNQHPALTNLAAVATAAQAKLRQVNSDTRNTPELALALTRERGSLNEPYQSQTKVTLKIPFGSESRNQPRITAANADLIEAQVLAEQTRRKLDAAITVSELELDQAQNTLRLRQEQLPLAEQSFAWVDKAFHAGQLDLPARLKAEADLAEVRLSLARAQLESVRAISRYNQAVGALP